MIGKRYAIIVGSNNYSKKNQLQCPLKDAKDISKILIKRCKFDADNIKLVLFEPQSQENKIQLDGYLEDIKSSFTKSRDTFLFYYSGHGDGYSLTPSILLCEKQHNGLNKDIEKETYPIQDIYDKIMDLLNPKYTYLIIDACHSGHDFLTGKSLKYDRFVEHHGKVVYGLYASTFDTKAYEPTLKLTEKHNITNSILTHFLIETLNSSKIYQTNQANISTIAGSTITAIDIFQKELSYEFITNYKLIPQTVSNSIGDDKFAFWDEKEEESITPPQIIENTEEEFPPVTKTYHYGVSYNSEKQPIITIDTIEFFNHRIRTAFGDSSGLKDYSAPEGVARLVKCLEDPILFYNEEDDYNSPEMTKYDNPYRKIIRQPIWFFRDGTFSIKKITKQTDTKILLYDQLQYGNSCYQVEISKVVAFISNRPYQNLIYIEVQAEQPLDDMYSYKSGQIEETYVVYDGEVLPQKDVDNSEIYRNGKLITIISSKKEEITRYIKPSNFIIGEQFGRWDDYSPSLDKILKGEMTLKELIEKVKRKERNDFEWEV